MSTWQTYPSGYPRHNEALERLARHWAAKLGYRVHHSVRKGAGKYMLLDRASSTVLLGAGYTAPIESVLEFLERERTQPIQTQAENVASKPDNDP
jgi:hypothetical protein